MRLTWQQVTLQGRHRGGTGETLGTHRGDTLKLEVTMALIKTCWCTSLSGGDVGHVQPVSGGDGPAGVLQVERGHLRFYWSTLELPAGNEVTFIGPVVNIIVLTCLFINRWSCDAVKNGWFDLCWDHMCHVIFNK